ncbi:MAG: neuraminidase-like domain-containing protein, partial [Smithellaceae bacterium]
EAKAYFTRFDISRATLLEDFQSAGNPADEAIAAEKLGLTAAERNLIVTPKANLLDQQSFWNAPAQWDTPPVMGNVLDYMKRVDHFLDKTGLAYNDLNLLLALKFIDPADNLFIKHLDLSCDTAQKEIANLNVAALDRIHRFLRWQKKTGWKLEVLDEIISQTKLGNGTLNDACLVKAADLLKLSEQTGIKIDELTGFYGEIPHTVLTDDAPKPLYQQIFLNKAKNGFIDEGLLPEKIDGTSLLSNFITSISVCLQIKEQDLNKLLPLLPDGALTFSNLSSLFAASRLMRKMKLKADDYVILTDLTGLNPSNSPADTLDFVEAVNSLNKSPLKLADVQFMLQHEAGNLADREIKDDKIKQILEKLQQDYQSNFSTNKSLFNANMSAQEQKEILQNALAKLSSVGEEDVKTFIKFIERDWTSANDAKTFTDSKLNGLFDTTAIKSNIDALAAAPGPDISGEQKDLVKAFLDAIAGYQLQAGKQTILEQTLATTFKADLELVKIVLKYALLKQPAPGTSFLSGILSADALIDVDITHTIPVLPAVTAVAFADQYRALRLAHKLFPLINSFKLENQDVEWFFQNNKALGWLEWDGIPYQAGQAAVDYADFMAFAEMVDLLKLLTPVPNPADIEHPISFFTLGAMLLPASGAARNQFLEAFSLLTGYNKEDIDALDAHFFPVFNLSNYRDPRAWISIIGCAGHLRKLGSTVAQVKEYIKPVLTDADTRLLRTALKARYDEDTWLSTLQEIMDAIRPQKRDALVAYLLAENPQMKTVNDLYDYFLVDVAMEACMPSSRIVQAHGAIQLFVQRCLMGLEPKAAADADNDAGWAQWKWMKNYRVWEANRKVFVYPENWIEAELRDDKSFLFTELENELQQNELTEFTAENALIRYLEKLDNIAFLEVTATWYQSDIKTMHVFARTKGGDPAIYYYRRLEKERYWTPWEKVELDITGDHLLAFERNNRLCLAWPVFSEEPDPNQGATLPDQSKTAEQPVDKPRKKLKIQLAVSEYANKKWQPKKISQEGILTPSNYTADDNQFKRDIYNLLYFEFGQQVWLYTAEANYINLKGIFNIAGCKGYPELAFQGNQSLPDFFPDFKDTWLKSQRYNEQNLLPADDLSVRNALSFFQFYEILGKTPGTFRLTYPHQLTVIDLVALLFQYLLMHAYGSNKAYLSHYERFLKIPLGTLLPYFEEDSNHAYVIIPGFYGTEKDPETGEPLNVQRTGSNVMQLIEDIIALFMKYMAKYAANPDVDALLKELAEDEDYQEIVDEFKVYAKLSYGEQFKNMYHPLVCALRKTLYKDGIAALM